MKIALKLLAAALLSLTIGVACASPLLIEELNVKPYPGNPMGPQADTSISVVYANFTTRPGNPIMSGNRTLPYSTSYLDYEVILNVTNLSDFGTEVDRLGLTAAQDIYSVPSAVGYIEYVIDTRSSGGGSSGGTPVSEDFVNGTLWSTWGELKNKQWLAGGSGLMRGVWLDGNWINVTWIPGTQYPKWPAPSGGWIMSGTNTTLQQLLNRPSLSETWPTTQTVPPMPENISAGTWIEGVPILEMQNITVAKSKTLGITTQTAIFVNGTWVDVSGRVKTAQEQFFARATNTITRERRYFGAEPPIFLNPPQNGTVMPANYMRTAQNSFTKTGVDEFNNYWAPHQSRLILLKGTRELKPEIGADQLQMGQITLLAEQFNHVQDPSVNNTAYYTYSGGYWLNQVPLQQTGNYYVYSALPSNQVFTTDRFGVEVFLNLRS